jgi:hypothetical protein
MPGKGKGKVKALLPFVSREHFVMEMTRPEAEAVADDSMNLATLAFGDSGDDGGATLPWGQEFVQESPLTAMPSRPLATLKGLTNNGLHLRTEAGGSHWAWYAKDEKVDVYKGDCVSLLLESPPGSGSPGPARHLRGDEARCLLGLVFEPRPAVHA